MKLKYLFIIGVSILFLLIIMTTIITKKINKGTDITINNISNSTITKTNKSNTTSSQANTNSRSENLNNKNPINETVPGLPKTKRTPLTNTKQSKPTPTQSPISAFSSSLNSLFIENNSISTINATIKPVFIKNKLALSPTPIDPMKNFINALDFLFSNNSSENSSQNQYSQNLSPGQSSITIIPLLSNKVHYPQCDGPYDEYPLPGGCNMCKAGCGPTSVAMILSSYIDIKFNPPNVVELYKQSGYEAGCNGTTVGDAQKILIQNGIQTTDIMYYGDSTTSESIKDFKSYLNNGWTLFTLARFCQKGCGHFFWITEVDKDNNVWAYDPGYGKKIVPLNENSLYPQPRYYVAFGVKKLVN